MPFDEHQPQTFAKTFSEAVDKHPILTQSDKRLTVICRKGNDSQRAVALIREKFSIDAVDVQGGLLEWNRGADPQFPLL